MQQENMFYSHSLLSKKGSLGVVWMAAHCHKRLKKDQVQRINISTSVDKILNDEVPVVTHRILAFLLLGVVRIFSKKVEYLCDDCNDLLNKLCGFSIQESKQKGIGPAPDKYCNSIVLPNSFELDAFDLELHEDQDFVGRNVRSREQIMLEDAREKVDSLSLLYKESTDNTPPRDIFLPQHMDKGILIDASFNMKISLSGFDTLRGTGFSLGDQMEPMVLDEDEEEHMCNNAFQDNSRAIVLGAAKEMKSNSVKYLANNTSPSVPSLEILCGTVTLSEDHTDLTVLYGAGKEQTNDTPATENTRAYSLEPIQDVEFNDAVSPLSEGSDVVASSVILHGSGISLEHSPSLKISSEAEKGQGCNDEPTDCFGVIEKHVESLGTQLRFQEDEPHEIPELVDKAKSMVVNKRKFLEVITHESTICQNMDASPTSKVAQDPKLSDMHSPNVAHIMTPAAKEPRKILKRRSLFDSTTILPNKVIRNRIQNASSDLKRERMEVPSTVLQAWRECKFVHATPSFFEPLLSGISEDLCFLQCDESCAAAISAMELSTSKDDIRSPVTQVVTEQILDIGSHDTESSPGQTSIAPRTPASHLFQLRSHEIKAIADSGVLESSTSVESIEKSSSSDGGLELAGEFCDVETNLCDADSLENYTFSARTRMLGSHLDKKFKAKRMKGKKEVLNMSHLLERKTKKESARLFYEILVLKTRDCIDVQQENAYDDIMLREASKLKLVIEC